MIDELTMQKIKCYDNRFGVKSQIFSDTNMVVITTPLDEYILKITNKKYKNICVYHQNRRGRRDKYHIQSWKNSLFDCYDSIYKHKRCLCVLNTPSSTYNKGINK